jgi:hypothetical protein
VEQVLADEFNQIIGRRELLCDEKEFPGLGAEFREQIVQYRELAVAGLVGRPMGLNRMILSQLFGSKVIARADNFFSHPKPEEGKLFRSYVSTALKHYYLDSVRQRKAVKRGGTVRKISFDDPELLEFPIPADDSTNPEIQLSREFAQIVWRNVVQKGRLEYVEQSEAEIKLSKAEKYDALINSLLADKEMELGKRFGMTEVAWRQAVRRLRLCLRRLMKDAIADTGNGDDEVIEGELKELRAAVGIDLAPVGTKLVRKLETITSVLIDTSLDFKTQLKYVDRNLEDISELLAKPELNCELFKNFKTCIPKWIEGLKPAAGSKAATETLQEIRHQLPALLQGINKTRRI